jgi:metacaspase-1
MFSGCRDDQTSADANIQGMSEGAMSWAFLETMRRIPNPSYIEVRNCSDMLRDNRITNDS